MREMKGWLFYTSAFLVLISIDAATISQPAGELKPIVKDAAYKRVCYYTNWSQYRKQPARFLPFNIDPFLCTHVIFSFSKIDYNGHLAPYEWNDIQYPHMYRQFNGLKKKNPKLKTLLAVGGWTHGSKPFTDMVKTDKGRQSFIDHAVQYLRTHNFDGLDLDWEYPANRGSPQADKQRFSVLCKELKQAFVQESERTGKEKLLLTAAVGGGEKIVLSAYEVPAISKHLDFINLMSYDLFGGWSKTLGTNAGLYAPNNIDGKVTPSHSVDGVVQLWLELGADPAKLIMGIPLYGRSFTICGADKINLGDKNCGVGKRGPFTMEKGFMAYYEVLRKLKEGWTRKWLDDQQVPIAFNLAEKQWIGYDDVESVKIKAEYVKKNKLGGAMVWAVDLDDFGGIEGDVNPLSRAIRSTLEGDDVEFPKFNPPTIPQAKKPRQRKRPIYRTKITEKNKPYKPGDKKNDVKITSATFKNGLSSVPIVTHPSILVHTVHDSTNVPTSTPPSSVFGKNNLIGNHNKKPISVMKKKLTEDSGKYESHLTTTSQTTTKLSYFHKTTDNPTLNTPKHNIKQQSKLSSTAKPRIPLEPASISLWDTIKTTLSFKTTKTAKTSSHGMITTIKSDGYLGAQSETTSKSASTGTTPIGTTIAYPWSKENGTTIRDSTSTGTTITFPWSTEKQTHTITHDSTSIGTTISFPWRQENQIQVSKSLNTTNKPKSPEVNNTVYYTTQVSATITADAPGNSIQEQATMPSMRTSLKTTPSSSSTKVQTNFEITTMSSQTTQKRVKGSKTFANIFKKYKNKFLFPTRQPRRQKSEIKYPFIHKKNIIWRFKGKELSTPRPRTTNGQIKITQSQIAKKDSKVVPHKPTLHLTTKKHPSSKPATVGVVNPSLRTTTPDSQNISKQSKPSKFNKKVSLFESPFSMKEYKDRLKIGNGKLNGAKQLIKVSSKSMKSSGRLELDSWRIGTLSSTTGITTPHPIHKKWKASNVNYRATTTKPDVVKSSESTLAKKSMFTDITAQTTHSNTIVRTTPVTRIFSDMQSNFKKNKKVWVTSMSKVIEPTTPKDNEFVIRKVADKRTNYITLRRHKTTHEKNYQVTHRPFETMPASLNKTLVTSYSKSWSPPTTVASAITTTATISPQMKITASIWSYYNNATFKKVAKVTDLFQAAMWKSPATPNLSVVTTPKTISHLHLNLRDPLGRESEVGLRGFKPMNLGSLSNEIHDKKEYKPFINPLNKFSYTEIRHPINQDPRYGLLQIPRKTKNSKTRPPQVIYGLMTPKAKPTTEKVEEGDIVIKKGIEKIYQYVFHTTKSPITMPWDTPDSIRKRKIKKPLKLTNIFTKPSKYSNASKPKGKWQMIKNIASTQNFNAAPRSPVVTEDTRIPFDEALYSLNEEYKYNKLDEVNWRNNRKYEVDAPQVILRKQPERGLLIEDFNCPTVFGIFADDFNCQRFYQCVWFVSFHHTCGQGTVWNDNLKICDWPSSNSCIS